MAKLCCAVAVAAGVMTSTTRAETLPAVQTVFVVVLENHNWADFKGNADAPFLNNTLLPMASYCGQYHNPPQLHPSEPNYLWLEAGTNFGILDDNGPSANHQNTTNHLTAQLRRAGISWKSYQEDIAGNVVPLVPVNGYVPRHDPFVFFDDVTGTNNPYDAYGIAHLRPYSELAGDLASNSVARYNFITPDLCNDGHNSCAPQYDPIRQTDDWLAREIPKIIDSAAYSNNGALFITWDESETGDAPIGLILLSPLARGGGYSNDIYYTHSSLLRTLQKIFGVSPWLGDAANATDLSDLFAQYKISLSRTPTKGTIQLRVSGFASDTTNFVETSTNLTTWSCVSTNWSSSNSFSIEAKAPTNVAWRFYRVRQAP